MIRITKVFSSLFVILFLTSITFANSTFADELRLLEQDLFRLKELINNNSRYLESESNEKASLQVNLIEGFLESATYYLNIDDIFEAELQVELAKITLAKAYQASSRSPLVETRAISIDASTLSKKALTNSIQELVLQIKDTGFNTIFVEVLRDDGYVVYPSEYMKIAPELEGLDPLGELVEVANSNDIDVFPWQKVFFAAANGTPGPILGEHPEWTALDRNQKGLDAYSLAWFSPGNTEAREFIYNYILEMWQKYDFAGCQLDYVRNAVNPLEDNDFSYDPATLELFTSLYGYNPLELDYPPAYIRTQPEYIPGSFGLKWESWQAFREELVTSMVARLVLGMKEIKPDALISCGIATALWGGGTMQQAYFRQQNWPVWVERHQTEILSPLVYQNDLSVVEREVKAIREIASGRVMQYPSLGILAMDSPYQLLQQIEAVRNIGEPGVRIFAYPHMKSEHFNLLKEGPFREVAFPPHRDLFRASYLLLQDLVSKLDPLSEIYEDLDTLKNRLEINLDGNQNRKNSSVKYLLTRLSRVSIPDDIFVQTELERLKTILNLYQYTNQI